jgi:hypothetical protein
MGAKGLPVNREDETMRGRPQVIRLSGYQVIRCRAAARGRIIRMLGIPVILFLSIFLC